MKLVTLWNDPDITDPTEWDSSWKVYSFNRRHRAYADPERFFPGGHPTIGLRRRLEVGLAFPLGYSEHGACLWYRQDWPITPRRAWGGYDPDAVRFAGLLVWEHPPREMGARTLAERRADADHFLETYTAWCDGEGYGFTVEDIGPHGERELVDSMGGFYGNDLDYMMEQVQAAVGDDLNVEFAGEARWLADRFRHRDAPGTPHGPWTLRQGLERGVYDPDEVDVWSDWARDRGYEDLAVDYQEVERYRQALKKR